jgi:hypothetical protein
MSARSLMSALSLPVHPQPIATGTAAAAKHGIPSRCTTASSLPVAPPLSPVLGRTLTGQRGAGESAATAFWRSMYQHE